MISYFSCIKKGLTAYYGLYHVAKEKIKEGKTLVVSAASGGVGQMVLQLGKQAGMRVVAITGGEEKRNSLLSSFAIDAAVDYKSEHFQKQLEEACPNRIDGKKKSFFF